VPKVQPVQGAHGGRGSARTRRVATALAEINVVPLVDVMLVLLIIFMVTAPMLQRGLDVNLPVAQKAQQITGERIFVSVPLSYRRDHVVRIGQESVRVEILAEKLRQRLQNRPDKEVYLQGDGQLSFQDVIEVMDRLREGGIEKVGLISKLPGER
jgi:biopolymer transport protein ExbD